MTESNRFKQYDGETLNMRPHGRGTMIWTNGDIYEGDWFNALQNGQGTMRYAIGEEYTGCWKDGKPNGAGRKIFKNGDIYSGNWFDGSLSGTGTYTYKCGDVYTGQWQNNLKSGQGVYAFGQPGQAGHNFSGWFLDGQPKGAGTYCITGCAVFQGDFSGFYMGDGTVTAANGDMYTGHWQDLRLVGQCTKTTQQGDRFEEVYQAGVLVSSNKVCGYQQVNANYPSPRPQPDIQQQNAVQNEKNNRQEPFNLRAAINLPPGGFNIAAAQNYPQPISNQQQSPNQRIVDNNSDYYGEVLNQRPHGRGIRTWGNGNVYDGQWVDGYLTGQGKFVYKNGDIYEGNWFQNVRCGAGKMTKANGDIYVGNFDNNLYEGTGTLTFKNGNVFQGNWKAGQQSGNGAMKFTNGDVYVGNYYQDLQSGIGKCRFACGDEYNGNWTTGKMSGQGIYTFAQYGHIFQGLFVDGQPNGKGKYSIPGVMTFEGDFTGYYDGTGTATATNGDVYIGQWVQMQLVGNQVRTTSQGDKYEEVYQAGVLMSSKKVYGFNQQVNPSPKIEVLNQLVAINQQVAYVKQVGNNQISQPELHDQNAAYMLQHENSQRIDYIQARQQQLATDIQRQEQQMNAEMERQEQKHQAEIAKLHQQLNEQKQIRPQPVVDDEIPVATAGESFESEDSADNDIPCPLCQKPFTIEDMPQHLQSHDKLITCPIPQCNMKFKIEEMPLHLQSHVTRKEERKAYEASERSHSRAYQARSQQNSQK